MTAFGWFNPAPRHAGLAMSQADLLLARTAAETGVPVSDILGPSRRQATVAARFRAIRYLLVIGGLPVGQIARQVHRDHATVSHALKRMGV